MNLLRRVVPVESGSECAAAGAATDWLHGSAASRRVEAIALSQHAPHALMQRAGEATARLALAMVPHARRIWVAAGPGNNGGDGLVAARLLHQAGKTVEVTWLGDPAHLSDDAAWALADAQQAGLVITASEPDGSPDLAIDALLGLGGTRAPEGRLLALIERLNAMSCPTLAIDLPSGLCADTGRLLGAQAVRAASTLSLLTLKPGLFTGHGRDHAGSIWFADLGAVTAAVGTGLADAVAASDTTADAAHAGGCAPTARLGNAEAARQLLAPRRHAQHKGSFGDLWVIGGARGMTGAAVLASRAGLAAGAGRVLVNLLADDAARPGTAGPALTTDSLRPELMHRDRSAWQRSGVLEAATIVCGCGGGDAMGPVLPALLTRAARLLLDADALNAVASDGALATLLERRGQQGRPTVLTPHPLEAARLLACSAADVQSERLAAAQALSERFSAVVVLKGSGSVVTLPQRTRGAGRPGAPLPGAGCAGAPASTSLPVINPTGNARLATAGSGDVLAGWLGGLWSRHAGAASDAPVEAAPLMAHQAAEAAVWLHGRAAELDGGSSALALPASDLINGLLAAVRSLAR